MLDYLTQEIHQLTIFWLKDQVGLADVILWGSLHPLLVKESGLSGIYCVWFVCICVSSLLLASKLLFHKKLSPKLAVHGCCLETTFPGCNGWWMALQKPWVLHFFYLKRGLVVSYFQRLCAPDSIYLFCKKLSQSFDFCPTKKVLKSDSFDICFYKLMMSERLCI